MGRGNEQTASPLYTQGVRMLDPCDCFPSNVAWKLGSYHTLPLHLIGILTGCHTQLTAVRWLHQLRWSFGERQGVYGTPQQGSHVLSGKVGNKLNNTRYPEGGNRFDWPWLSVDSGVPAVPKHLFENRSSTSIRGLSREHCYSTHPNTCQRQFVEELQSFVEPHSIMS